MILLKFVVLCFIVFLCASPSCELVVFDPGKWLYRTRSEGLTGYFCLSVLLPLRVRLGHLSWNNFGRFRHTYDPMDAEDWLRTVERELHTAQCDDREKVLYGPRLLREAAQSWWESYLATHANPDTITWEEFRDNFCQYHVPAGLMIVKKEEFLALKQGPMSVSEYRDKFLQLSRYAPEDVNADAKRQYRFLRGLVDPMQYHLMNHTFPTFQHLIDRSIMTEKKRKEMEDRKRKIGGPQPRSSNRPRFSGNPPQRIRQNQRPPQQQFQRQYPQHQQQNC
jgi:hypothetical protein